MTFNPDPNTVFYNFDLGVKYTIDFEYSDKSYTLSNSDLPTGFKITQSGNPWKIDGIVIDKSLQTSLLQFTLSKPNSESINASYIVTYNTVKKFACVSNVINDGVDMYIINFPCVEIINDTILGNSIGNAWSSQGNAADLPNNYTQFDLELTIDEPNQYTYTFLNPMAILFIKISLDPVKTTYKNVTPVNNNNLIFKLNNYNVTYDFSALLEKSLIVTITGSIPLNIFNNNNISTGLNDNISQNVQFQNLSINNSIINLSILPYPQIIINSIDTDGQNNIAYMFYIIDTVKYKSESYSFENFYRTDFVEYPQIQTVLRGSGYTLNDKIKFVIKNNKSNLSYSDFYKRISFYAATRYILSYVLYGKFSVKYLLGEYYQKFLRDLKNSRFHKFRILFGDPQYGFVDYHRYFLYSGVVKKCQGNIQNCKIIISSNVTK